MSEKITEITGLKGSSIKVVGDIAEITDKWGNTERYNRESLLVAIQNIRHNRSDYFTEQAYSEHVKMYQSALNMMDNQDDRCRHSPRKAEQ